VRMEAFAGEKTQGIVNIDYGRVKGAGWLPEKTRIDIFLDAPPAAASAPGDSTRPRLPEKGVIDLVFHEYEVNVGLPDSLFEEVSP
jgi:hypothetical protein